MIHKFVGHANAIIGNGYKQGKLHFRSHTGNGKSDAVLITGSDGYLPAHSRHGLWAFLTRFEIFEPADPHFHPP